MSNSMIVLIPRSYFVHGDENFLIQKLKTLSQEGLTLRKGRMKTWIGAEFIFVSEMETKFYCDTKEGR